MRIKKVFPTTLPRSRSPSRWTRKECVVCGSRDYSSFVKGSDLCHDCKKKSFGEVLKRKR